MTGRIIMALGRLVPFRLVRRVNTWQFTGPVVRRRLVRRLSRSLSARDGRVGRGPGAGLLIDPGGTNPGFLLGTTEPAVQAALAEYLRPGDVFYDIGANVGFFSLIAARLVGETGSVCAFEPVPRYARLLETNARRNGFANVRVIPRAVSVATRSDTLLLAGPDSPAGTNRLQTVAGEDDRRVKLDVTTVSVDELVTSREIPPPHVVKIDVEGAELDVLRGMHTTLARHAPVLIVELHWTEPEFLALAREALPGYELKRLGEDGGPDETRSWMHVAAIPVKRDAS